MKKQDDVQGVPGAEPPVGLSETPLRSGPSDPAAPVSTIPHARWLSEARSRFGDNPMLWRFVCPACGWAASVQEWKDAGADETEAAFSCIGRRVDIPTRCNYAGGGLFRINPVHVLRDSGAITTCFAFAPDDHVQPTKLSGFRPR